MSSRLIWFAHPRHCNTKSGLKDHPEQQAEANDNEATNSDQRSLHRQRSCGRSEGVGHHAVRKQLLHPLPLPQGEVFQKQLHTQHLSVQRSVCLVRLPTTGKNRSQESGMALLAAKSTVSIYLV